MARAADGLVAAAEDSLSRGLVDAIADKCVAHSYDKTEEITRGTNVSQIYRKSWGG